MEFDHELLLSLASGLGRWSDGPDGAPVYTKDDDCVACLKDLQRFLRRDDPSTRPAFTLLSRFNLAKSDLVPLMTRYADDEEVVVQALKVATFLTMPVAPDSDRQLAQAEAAAAAAGAFLAPGALPVAVSLLAEPLSRHPAMSEDDARTVQLVLTFLRNLVAAPAAVLRRLRGGGGGPVPVIPPGLSGVGAGKAPKGAPAPASADGGCAPPLGCGGAADGAARLRTRLVAALVGADVPELLLLVAQRSGEASGARGSSTHPLRMEAPLLLDAVDALLEGLGPEALWEGACADAAAKEAAAARREKAPPAAALPPPPTAAPGPGARAATASAAARRAAALAAADPASARLLAAAADRDRAARHALYREGPLRGPRWGAVFVRRLDASTELPLAGNPRGSTSSRGGGGGKGGKVGGGGGTKAFAPGGRARLTSAPTAQPAGSAGLLGGAAPTALGAYALSFLDRGGWAGIATALGRDLADGPLLSRLSRDDFERYARCAAKFVGLARVRAEASARAARGEEAGAAPVPRSLNPPSSSPFAGVAPSLGWDALALARGLWATAASTAAAAPDKDWPLQHATLAWLKEMLLALDAAAAGAAGEDDRGAASRLVRRLLFDSGGGGGEEDEGEGGAGRGAAYASTGGGGGLVALLASGASRFNPRFQPRSHAADLAAALHVALRLHDRVAADDAGARVAAGTAAEVAGPAAKTAEPEDGVAAAAAAPLAATPPPPPSAMDLSPSPSPRPAGSPSPEPPAAAAAAAAEEAAPVPPAATATPGPPRAEREAAPPPDTVRPPRVVGPLAVPPTEEATAQVGGEAGRATPPPAPAPPAAESPAARRARAAAAGAAAASARVRAHLTSPPVVHFYFWLAAGYAANPPPLNRAIAAFFRRVRSRPPAGCDLAPLLWQARGLAVMRDILADTAWRAGGGHAGSAARALAGECAAVARGLFSRLLPPPPPPAAEEAAEPGAPGSSSSSESEDDDGASGGGAAAAAADRAVAAAEKRAAAARDAAAAGACASLLAVEILFWKPPAAAEAVRDQYDWRLAYGGERRAGSPGAVGRAAALRAAGAAAVAEDDPNLPDEEGGELDGPATARLAVLAEEARAARAASAGSAAGYAPAGDPAWLAAAGRELGVPAGVVRRQCRLLGVGGRAGPKTAAGPQPGDAARLASLFHEHAGKRAALDLITEGMAGGGGGGGGRPSSWWTRPRVARALAAAGLKRGVMSDAHLDALTALHAEYGAAPGGLDSIAAQLPGGWRTEAVARALKRAGLALAGAAARSSAHKKQRKQAAGGPRPPKKARRVSDADGSAHLSADSEDDDDSVSADSAPSDEDGGAAERGRGSASPARVASCPPAPAADAPAAEEDEAAERARAAAAVKSALAALRAKRAAGAAPAPEEPSSSSDEEGEGSGADENVPPPPPPAPEAAAPAPESAPAATTQPPAARKRLRLGKMNVESRVAALAFSSDDEA